MGVLGFVSSCGMDRGSTLARGVLIAITLLAACSVPEERPDRLPPPIDPAAVPDAVPTADPIRAAGNTSPYEINGRTYRVLASAAGYEEDGVASWYGLKFHGRPTANGERFSVYGPTAAHRSLPIPTYVRVTNLENGRQMVVRVNDRGPFHDERLIDLSYGAALKLGFADQGTAKVRITALLVAGVDDLRGGFDAGASRYLQLGAYASIEAAEALAERARRAIGVSATVVPVETGSGLLYRVRLGPYPDDAQLASDQQALEASDLPRGSIVVDSAT